MAAPCTDNGVPDLPEKEPRLWLYFDADQQVQGPFAQAKVLEWYGAGLLPADLPMCPTDLAQLTQQQDGTHRWAAAAESFAPLSSYAELVKPRDEPKTKAAPAAAFLGLMLLLFGAPNVSPLMFASDSDRASAAAGTHDVGGEDVELSGLCDRRR